MYAVQKSVHIIGQLIRKVDKMDMHECYQCESSFADILDLIAHLRQEHGEK